VNYHQTHKLRTYQKFPTWLFTKSNKVWHPKICTSSCRDWSRRIWMMLSKLLANKGLPQ